MRRTAASRLAWYTSQHPTGNNGRGELWPIPLYCLALPWRKRERGSQTRPFRPTQAPAIANADYLSPSFRPRETAAAGDFHKSFAGKDLRAFSPPPSCVPSARPPANVQALSRCAASSCADGSATPVDNNCKHIIMAGNKQR